MDRQLAYDHPQSTNSTEDIQQAMFADMSDKTIFDKALQYGMQAGNVNSGSFDDFSSICQKAQQAGAWVHINGAFGLLANASKELYHLTQGIEYAHSWAADGHKTLNVPYVQRLRSYNQQGPPQYTAGKSRLGSQFSLAGPKSDSD